MLAISGQYFSLLQLCSSFFRQPFGSYSCLPYPWSQFLPSATSGSCLPALGFIFISDSWLLSAQQGPWYLSSQHGSHYWPALPCSGLAPEHGLPHVMVQESATDQTPPPPANLRQIVTCLISGPTAPFILVFSAGYNHELDTPGKQYLHICCSIIIGSNRERSLPVFLWEQKHQIMLIRLHKPEYLPTPTSYLRRADKRLSQGISRNRDRRCCLTPTRSMIKGEKIGGQGPVKQKITE